jgi:L-cysteine S-thiosulfotransferase
MSRRKIMVRGVLWVAVFLVACSSTPTAQDTAHETQAVLQSSFRAQGIATLDRLNQDELQQACSSESAPPPDVAKRLEEAQLAAIQWPADGVYLGDWKRGEALAQSGRGMTWNDAPGAPSGGNCYNCHQLAPAEISYGTLGPSLLGYGRLRGVVSPTDPAAAAVIKYTWGKLWNAKAYNACSGMPRFGGKGVLTPAQIQDLMALLLDPQSPVNR